MWTRARAGVGFAVNPNILAAAVAFKACSDRLAALGVQIKGGVLILVGAYAPRSGRDCEPRHSVHCELPRVFHAITAHGTILIFDDSNAKLLQQGAGE
eukprot:9138010-Pyramimonas_sp.AAC.1